MDGELFSRLRARVGKSQKDLAILLGISRKAVESYEQGWRRVPASVERMLYFLTFKLNGASLSGGAECWTAKSCPEPRKKVCPAWISGEGRFCWFITGRLCSPAGSASGNASGSRPDADCYGCEVFRSLLAAVLKDAKEEPCP